MSDVTRAVPTTSTSPPGDSPVDSATSSQARLGATDLAGQPLGDYRILRRLGQGGMGEIYLAEQVSLKRKVALKFLRHELAANPTALRRFQGEAEAVARVTHANIVQVYAIGAVDGVHYMALEYVHGRNLREYLNKKGPLDVPVALTIMRQVASALQKASESGIVHRDIKPENILLTRRGEVKVADFGLSRVFGGDQELNLTQSGMALGTPLYMSPEQVQGKPLDPRSDIYSFGVTCYHMLAGQPPYRGSNAFEVALQHVQSEPKPLSEQRPDLPPELCALVHSMMAKDPNQRPQTGREVLRLLSQPRGATAENPFAELNLTVPPGSSKLRSGTTDTTPAPTVRSPVLHPRRRLGLWLSLSLAAALLAGVGLRFAVNARSAPVAPPTVDDHPVLPLVNERERQLQAAIELYATPKLPEKIRLGAGHHVELGLLLVEQRRFADAEKLFEEMTKRPGAPPVYITVGQLGLAIVYALRDDAERSTKAFQAAKGTGNGLRAILPPLALPQEEMINLRFWMLTALERNAAHAPLPSWLDRARNDLKAPFPPRPGPAGKNG